MGKWLMIIWGIIASFGLWVVPKNSLRELAAALVMVLAFGFAFTIHAIEESKTKKGEE